ncbi:hypothetical protein AI27_08940 [Sphingomonas sp. BHC-A]|nr:hypothetical protein AI27_08940 [Sphingomonas sp. BHC-A]
MKRRRRLGAAQPGDLPLVAQVARDAGQRLEMLGARIDRGEQREDDVHRRFVHRVEGNRRVEQDDHAAHFLKARNLRMGNRDSAAKAGGPQLLALQQRFRHHIRFQAVGLGSQRRNLLKQLLLAVHRKGGAQCIRCDDIVEMNHAESQPSRAQLRKN